MEIYTSGIFVCVTSAGIFSLGCYVSVFQADLDSLQSMATLGIIHGVAEVLERSMMVVIDHFCHVPWKRRSAPWGNFRTPRRERLMADIVIISILYESIGLVSVNGVFFVYQLIYENESFANLLKSFAIQTSILLVIEWFFTSVSLAIETNRTWLSGLFGGKDEKDVYLQQFLM